VVLPFGFILLFLLLRLNLGGGYSIWDTGWAGYASSHLWQIITGLIYGTILIWRGISVGGQNNTLGDIYRRFGIGLAGLVVLLIIWSVTGGQIRNIWSDAGIYTLLFFGAGLLSLAIANLDTLRKELISHQEAAASFSRRWISMLIILVLVILGLGIAIASIFSSDIASTVLHGLNVFGNWLLTALIYLLYPVGFLVAGLIYVFRWLISLLTGGEPPPPFEAEGVPDLKDLTREQSPVQIPAALIETLKWLFVAAVFIMVIVFLARLITRRSERKTGEEVEEIHETLFSWEILMSDLRALLAWLFKWTKRPDRNSNQMEKRYTVPDITANPERSYNVRALYRAWLWEARKQGSPRKLAETPYEFQRRLGPEADKISTELDQITEAYIDERYGNVTPAPDKLKKLNMVWHVMLDKWKKPPEQPETCEK